ncbi:MAG: Uncharacterized protein AUREO_018920 [Aureobasidium pullulans]|nr:MAG: Uncharacterized protein AUREO_018920 [Aureobasidium pullulans]
MAPPVSSSDRHQNVTRDFHKQRNKYSLPPRFSSAEQQNLLIVIKMSNSSFQLSNVFDVKGKVALVTGGGSGIGLMATQALATNGSKVYIVGRTEEKLKTVQQTYGKDISGRIIPIVGDVTKKSEIEKLVKEIESKEGFLDILVNNAGIDAGKLTPDGKDAEEMKKNLFDEDSFEDWSDLYTTNVIAPFFLSTAFLPLLQKATERTHGWSATIINISSISGLVRISQGHFNYNASKGAVVHLNKMLSAEVQSSGLKIRINAIAPGVFPSEMTTGESKDDQKSELPKEHKGDLPSQRPGKESDMAAAVLFCAACQYLNGQNVPVDGGYLIQTGT